jgi:hypothetical protein
MMDKIEIEIKNGNDRVYVTEYGTATILLGDGGTTICDVTCDDGLRGVCFSEAVENNGVGADRADQVGGRRVDEISAYLQILTKNPDSFDVLIDKLILARNELEEAVNATIEK